MVQQRRLIHWIELTSNTVFVLCGLYSTEGGSAYNIGQLNWSTGPHRICAHRTQQIAEQISEKHPTQCSAYYPPFACSSYRFCPKILLMWKVEIKSYRFSLGLLIILMLVHIQQCLWSRDLCTGNKYPSPTLLYLSKQLTCCRPAC